LSSFVKVGPYIRKPANVAIIKAGYRSLNLWSQRSCWGCCGCNTFCGLAIRTSILYVGTPFPGLFVAPGAKEVVPKGAKRG
jgi:hypothetical protein